MNINWSKFAYDRHQEGAGNSFFTIPHDEVIDRVKWDWEKRYPGQGETGVDRKVVVAIGPGGFFLSTTALRDDLPLRAEVVRRQPGEDPYVEMYVDADDAKALGIEYEPASYVNIVLYSVEALLENGGERTHDNADWEIVAVLASKVEKESMEPLTMARNFLEKAGGTKSVYTAQEFAEAIYYNSQRGIKIKKQKTKNENLDVE